MPVTPETTMLEASTELPLLLEWFLKAALIYGGMLVVAALTTLAERKVSAWIQYRIGLNRVGPWGLLQPLADGVKFIFKEEVVPDGANRLMFRLAPIVAAVPAMMAVAVIVWIRRGRISTTTGAIDRGDLRAMAVLMMAYVVLTPTLHPWYLITLMALLPFVTPGPHESRQRWWLLAPWTYLAAAVVFSYLTYLDPLAHGERTWVRQLEWYPTLLLLAWALLRARADPGPWPTPGPSETQAATTMAGSGQNSARSSPLPGREPG